MNDRYLWDRTGKPDPEIARLEEMLSVFRFDGARRPVWNWRRLAIAAVLAMAALFGVGQMARVTRVPAQRTEWQAVRLEGSPQVNGHSVDDPASLYTGQRIQTDAKSRVQVRSEFVGQVELEPNSEMSVKESREHRQLLTLRRGTLHALIWAPPGQFAVDTPSVRAIDLGCAYTLETESNGDGLITVQTGWVAFDHEHVESFVPADAACRINGRRGPGVPWFQDAPEALGIGLRQFEETRGEDALRATLSAARPRDGLTLWHLLSRVSAHDKGLVFDRFASVVKLPPEVRREEVIAGNTHAMDLCWNALDLGDTSWWRTWKQAW